MLMLCKPEDGLLPLAPFVHSFNPGCSSKGVEMDNSRNLFHLDNIKSILGHRLLYFNDHSLTTGI